MKKVLLVTQEQKEIIDGYSNPPFAISVTLDTLGRWILGVECKSIEEFFEIWPILNQMEEIDFIEPS